MYSCVAFVGNLPGTRAAARAAQIATHPDRHGGSLEAKTASQWANRAAEVLGDAAKRRLYVHSGHNYAAYALAEQEVERAAAAEQQRRADEEAERAERKRQRAEQIEGRRVAQARVAEAAAGDAEMSTEARRAARQQGHEQRTASGKAHQHDARSARRRAARARQAAATGDGVAAESGDGS